MSKVKFDLFLITTGLIRDFLFSVDRSYIAIVYLQYMKYKNDILNF